MKTIVNQFDTLSFVASGYTIREEELDGKKHLVVPVVMMVEGVHSGSKGPILHTEEELAKWTEAWDGIPVTISHPQEGKTNVSANSPTVLDSWSVGRIFNTVYDNGLKAEAWVDAEKISEKSPEAHEAILSGEPLEVSVGVFNDTETTDGTWDGETYDSIAYNYRPDHLALLPGAKGACSWEDGCGIRVNKKGVAMKDQFKTFEELSQKGYVVSLINNAQGYREIQEALSVKLRDLNSGDTYHYIEEVYDDHIIYSKWVDGGDGRDTLYRQDYDMDDKSEVVFNGLSAEVRKNVEYVTMKMRRTKINSNNKNKGGKMTEKGSLCCEAKVDALIANKATHWQASDREWLLTQGESTISKMSPMTQEVVKPTAEEIQINNDAAVAAFKESLKTIEDHTAIMPEAMKVSVDGGVKLYNEHRVALVKSILDNTKEVWDEDTLTAMDDKTLENVSKSIKVPADYTGLGAGGDTVVTTGEQVELPVEFASNGKEEK